MLEPLPFDDDVRADALAAFDGLVRALSSLAQQPPGSMGLAEHQLDAARFRLVDLFTAVLDAAGIEEGLRRLEALNLMAETLFSHASDVCEQELGEDLEESVSESRLEAILALARGSDHEMAAPPTTRPSPWQLPLLNAWRPDGGDRRN